MDGGAEVYLPGVCGDYPWDTDGVATVYYVFCDFCDQGIPEYHYGDYRVWAELGGVRGGGDKRRDFVGGPRADGGGDGARAIEIYDFY